MLNIEYLINIGQRLKWLAKFKAIYQLLGYRLNLMFTIYLGPTFLVLSFLFFGIMTNKLSSHTFTFTIIISINTEYSCGRYDKWPNKCIYNVCLAFKSIWYLNYKHLFFCMHHEFIFITYIYSWIRLHYINGRYCGIVKFGGGHFLWIP